ncbi:MAG: SiaB family protein kinase [Deferrisomatales bacterium]
MNDLHQLRQTLTRQGALICFNGPFRHSIIEELGTAVKRYLESAEAQKSAVTDVFSVYVEATQNVRNYAARPDLTEEERNRLDEGIIVISRQGERYTVSSGNPVRRADGQALKERLEHLRGLDKAALKALYKEQLRRELPPGARGAGLGLVDLARRASQPLEYALNPEDDRYDFFSLRVVI